MCLAQEGHKCMNETRSEGWPPWTDILRVTAAGTCGRTSANRLTRTIAKGVKCQACLLNCRQMWKYHLWYEFCGQRKIRLRARSPASGTEIRNPWELGCAKAQHSTPLEAASARFLLDLILDTPSLWFQHLLENRLGRQRCLTRRPSQLTSSSGKGM